VSLPQFTEAAEALASVAEAGAVEAVVGEKGSSPPRPVAADTEDVETRVPNESAAAVQELPASETMTRAASPEIQEVEETRAPLSQGVMGGEAETLELACTSWAATSGLGIDSEDDEEVAARNTLERGLTCARHTFYELILPTTSVIFSSKIKFSILWSSRVMPLIFIFFAADPRVFRSETCLRGARASSGADSVGDATRRGPGGGSWCRDEQGVRTDVP
jgi:hypothetical protein